MIYPSETYKAFANYYDLYVGNFKADLDFYLSLCNKEDLILEVGCGTGRVLQKFLQSNFRITGIDISDEMLDIARKKLKSFIQQEKLKLVNYDMSVKSMHDRSDKALVTFYTFNYILQQPEIFLKNLYNSLNKNGVTVFDLFYPKSLLDKTIDDSWTESSIKLNDKDILLKDKRILNQNIEFRSQIYIEGGKELQIETERRYYSPKEIAQLLQQAGFKNINFTTLFDKRTFTETMDEKILKTNFIVKAEK
jgi:ubiquinone/menaquinone biosynthesis C-methylase UbiE